MDTARKLLAGIKFKSGSFADAPVPDIHAGGPADATATHYLLLQEFQIGFGFTFLVPAHPGSPGQNPESRKTVA